MKNQLRNLCLGILGFSFLGSVTQAAVYITGDISFSGGATLNGPIASATAFTSFFGPVGPGTGVPVVAGATGAYAGVPGGTAADFTPFTFNPAPGVNTPFWSFSYGGNNYSFQITSLTIMAQNSNFLNIQGTGIAMVTGYDPTAGTFSLTDTGFGGSPVLTFGTGVSVVPEPALPVLIGMGILGLVLIRRRHAMA